VPIVTIVLGGLLTALGIVGFVMTGSQHFTALIPAIAGTLLEICGGLALNPKLRMHAMHGAVMIGLLGFLGTIPGLIKLARWVGGTAPERTTAVVSQSIMAGLCFVYVILCVRSFISARRARQAAQGFPVNPSSSTPS